MFLSVHQYFDTVGRVVISHTKKQLVPPYIKNPVTIHSNNMWLMDHSYVHMICHCHQSATSYL